MQESVCFDQSSIFQYLYKIVESENQIGIG